MRMSEMSMVMIKGEDEKRHEGKYVSKKAKAAAVVCRLKEKC